jgi:hypothetical protein
MEKQLAEHLAKTGDTLEQIEGYEPLTEDALTHQHIRFIRVPIDFPAGCPALGAEHVNPVSRRSASGLGCVKTSNERAKCHFGSTVEISTSMKSMT